MENTKKQGFCAGIPFLILQAICFFFSFWHSSILVYHNIRAGASDLLSCIALVAIVVFLLTKKQNIFLAASTGVLALLHLIDGVELLSLPAELQQLFFKSIIADLLRACVWMLITLIILSKNEIFAVLKEKIFLLEKIFYPVAIVSMGFEVLIAASSPSINQFLVVLDIWFDSSIHQFLNWLFILFYGIGLILLGKWILPTHKKKANTNNTSETIDRSEFYVSMGKHICLMLFTFGIWLMIWVHKVTKFCNTTKGEDQKNPTTSLLLYLFIPFYSIYWTYKMAQRIDKIAKEKGVDSDLGTICLILAIFVGFVPPILMQDKINGVLTSNGKPTENFDNGIEHLEKYKDLLDKGVITQEEFDAKKKQLLDL